MTSISKFLAGAVLASSLGLAAGPSMAQGLSIGPGGVRVDPGYRRDDRRGDRGDEDLTRGDAIRIARRSGLVDVDNVGRRGPRFVVRGSDRRGDDITVVVTAAPVTSSTSPAEGVVQDDGSGRQSAGLASTCRTCLKRSGCRG